MKLPQSIYTYFGHTFHQLHNRYMKLLLKKTSLNMGI